MPGSRFSSTTVAGAETQAAGAQKGCGLPARDPSVAGSEGSRAGAGGPGLFTGRDRATVQSRGWPRPRQCLSRPTSPLVPRPPPPPRRPAGSARSRTRLPVRRPRLAPPLKMAAAGTGQTQQPGGPGRGRPGRAGPGALTRTTQGAACTRVRFSSAWSSRRSPISSWKTPGVLRIERRGTAP